MQGGIEPKIEQLLEEKFKEEDFADCFLIEIALRKNNKLEVFVDSDSGITFSTCKRLSRYLEQYLDEEQWLGEKYTLEVSSPGTDRPLELKRQYQKNIGRQLKITGKEGTEQTGKLIAVGEDTITLEYEEVYREKKKKRKKIVQQEFALESIQKAVVKVSFK